MYELAKLGGYLVSPLTVSLGLWLGAALLLALRRRAWALGLASIAFAVLWAGSLPVVARALVGALESRYPVATVAATPSADAILVLGGSITARHPPKRPSLGLNAASTRVWHAAELYRAGKAKWVVVAAGSDFLAEGEQVEADAISEVLESLGVPKQVILRESLSRNTRENAANVQALLDRLGARRVLLVTSAQHMPRAVITFNKVWANSARELIPAPADVEVAGDRNPANLWIPSPSSLLGVTKALKEYAGMLALAII